jgi:hypothetical protein
MLKPQLAFCYPNLKELNTLQRTQLVILCTTLWSVSLSNLAFFFSVEICRFVRGTAVQLSNKITQIHLGVNCQYSGAINRFKREIYISISYLTENTDYCENHTKQKNIFCGQNADFFVLKQVVHIVTTLP